LNYNIFTKDSYFSSLRQCYFLTLIRNEFKFLLGLVI